MKSENAPFSKLKLETETLLKQKLETETSTPSITRVETIGFLVLALVVLAIILVRWGSVIPWSAR